MEMHVPRHEASEKEKTTCFHTCIQLTHHYTLAEFFKFCPKNVECSLKYHGTRNQSGYDELLTENKVYASKI